MRRQSFFIAIVSLTAVLGLTGPAFAQAPPSGGDLSQVFAVPYKCTPGPTVQGIPTWSRVTTVSVLNMNSGAVEPAADARTANAIFVDANENILGSSRGAFGLDLSPEDLDVINVCRTLQANGLPVPQSGVVEFYVAGGDPGGVYCWAEYLIGKFFVTIDDPFAGKVKGQATSQCRQVPLEVSIPMEIATKAIVSGAPQDVVLILIEDSEDLAAP